MAIEIINAPEGGSCGTGLACFKIDLETDAYKLSGCSATYLIIGIYDVATGEDGNSFTIQLNDADSNVLALQSFTFKTAPTGPFDILIAATKLETAQNAMYAITNCEVLMKYCEVFIEEVSGDYHIHIDWRCNEGEFFFASSISGSIIGEFFKDTGLAATYAEDFKVLAKIVECPYPGTGVTTYKTIVDNIEVFFDKNQTATVNLSNRIIPFLSHDIPDKDSLITELPNYSKKIKVLFQEFVGGVAGASAATGEFVVINSVMTIDEGQLPTCSGVYNQWPITLCRGQYAFAYFYISLSVGAGASIRGYDGENEEVFNESLDDVGRGLIAINLASPPLTILGDYMKITLFDEDGDPTDISVEVNYICDCAGNFSCLFLTNKGIFEPMSLRLTEEKLSVKKEIYDACVACGTSPSVFSVSSIVSPTFTSERIQFEDKDKWEAFLKSRKILINFDEEFKEYVDEGGSVSFKMNGLTELNFSINVTS